MVAILLEPPASEPISLAETKKFLGVEHYADDALIGAGPADQLIGIGDGTRTEFQLMKTYGSLHAPYARPIAKPVAGSVRIAVDGIEAVQGTDFDVDPVTGLVLFAPGQAPADSAPVTAGFHFDVPARFNSDFLEVDLAAFAAGEIPSIPIVEIRP